MTTILKTRVTGKEVKELSKEKVVFDPYNEEHRQAFRLMILAGRQTELRFELEGFETVPAMMMYKMAVYGAGAIDKVTQYEGTREVLQKRALLHELPMAKVIRFPKVPSFSRSSEPRENTGYRRPY